MCAERASLQRIAFCGVEKQVIGVEKSRCSFEKSVCLSLGQATYGSQRAWGVQVVNHNRASGVLGRRVYGVAKHFRRPARNSIIVCCDASWCVKGEVHM